jgi:hypothetical protein
MASPFLEGCAFLVKGVGLSLWIAWQVFGLMDAKKILLVIASQADIDQPSAY